MESTLASVAQRTPCAPSAWAATLRLVQEPRMGPLPSRRAGLLPERLLGQRSVDVRRDRLRFGVDLVGDVEIVRHLTAAVQRVEGVLGRETQKRLFGREETRTSRTYGPSQSSISWIAPRSSLFLITRRPRTPHPSAIFTQSGQSASGLSGLPTLLSS